MDLIYIVIGEGEYAPMPELDVRSQLAKGQLNAETYFWKEGMPDWLPLTQLPEPPPPAPPQPKPPPPVIQPQKPLHVAPGHAYIKATANRLKSTYPIALGRRIGPDQPFAPPETSGESTVALPRRTAAQPSWSPTPRARPATVAQPQAVKPKSEYQPGPAYIPAATSAATAPPAAQTPRFELEPVPTPVAAIPAPPIGPQYFAREDFEPMTSIVLGVLGLCFMSGLLLLYVTFKHYQLMTATYTFDQENASIARVAVCFHIALYLFLGAIIPFLIWVFRVSENCRGFIPGMRFTTGWVLVSFFVPILNLFRPLQAFQDIWKVSTKPLGWADRRSSVIVAFWGILWAACWVLESVALFFGSSFSGAAEDSVFAIEINIISSATYVGLCLVSAVMIFAITRKQKQLVAIE